MARINISIADELRERMVGLNCNWSAIAQAAFANAVEVEELKQGGQEMEAGLIRLRASKQSNVERERASGFAHGQNWALEDATYDELKEAAQLAEWARNHPEKASEVVQRLNEKLDRHGFDLPDFPKSNVSAPYALGYLEAVTDVFSKV